MIFKKINRDRLDAIVVAGIMLIWGTYCAFTVLYNSPDSSVKKTFAFHLNIFERIFYQKWTFFAPPPQHNLELTYIFTDSRSGENVAVSALEEILQLKRATSPFNQGAEALDYIMSGACDQVSRYLRTRNEIRNAKSLQKADFSLKSVVLEPSIDLAAVKTLRNYSAFLMKQNGLDPKYYIAKIVCYAKPIKLDGSPIQPSEWRVRFIINSFYAPSSFN